MINDQFGYDLTLTSTKAAEEWDKLVLAFLAHGAKTPEHLSAVLQADPNFAMAHATKGLFMLMLGRKELWDVAEDAYNTAKQAAARTQPTERERGYVRALAAWMTSHPSGVIAEMEAVLAKHPQDALAMKISHAVRFILGDAAGMRKSLSALLPKYDAQNPALGYALGCHAFALEETGDYELAETAGRRGLGLCKDDAWGLHAVAHVYDMTGDSEGGLKWLTGREEAWAHCNNFRYHVWWHKALMHLDQGDVETVLALYDNEIRQDKTDDYRDISNATSLLSRLELEGVDIGNRWEELADISENRTDDACFIFADLHYLLALVGGDRQSAVQEMLKRLQADAKASAPSEMQTRMVNPGLSVATGLEAFGEGDYKRAFLNLNHARNSMQLAGGSHAQRDVFERLTIDAGIRGGFLNEAQSIIVDRVQKRAGHEDTYASTRLSLIAEAQSNPQSERLPAE